VPSAKILREASRFFGGSDLAMAYRMVSRLEGISELFAAESAIASL